MIKDYGHTIYFYGVEGSEVACDEFIQVSTQEVLKSTYGDYDRSKNFFQQNPNDFAHQYFNQNTINAILENKQDQDIPELPHLLRQKVPDNTWASKLPWHFPTIRLFRPGRRPVDK